MANAGQFKLSDPVSGGQRIAGVSGNSRQRRRAVRRWLADGLRVQCLYIPSSPLTSFKTAPN